MVQIDIAYVGELRCEATHAPSSCQLQTDAPVDNQGRGESFSPTDLLATAVGTCLLTIMGIVANKRGWDLGSATAQVEKHMLADPLRRVAKLTIKLRLTGDLGEAARTELVAAALSCPVTQSISDKIELDLEWVWGSAAA
ncbi:MAG: putative redox protein [Candidatus Paceibacteria bacterium]|jgi:putative redox protein